MSTDALDFDDVTTDPATSASVFDSVATFLMDPIKHINHVLAATLQVNCECTDRIVHQIHPGH